MKQTTIKRAAAYMLACYMLALTACSKNDSSSTTTPDKPDTAYPAALLLSVHEVGGTAYDSLSYSSGKLVLFASYDSPLSSTPNYQEQYLHASNGMAARAVASYGNTVDRKDTLVYSQGKLVVYGLIAAGGNQWDKDTTELLLNSNGQVTQTDIRAGSNYKSRSTYTYEGKNILRFSSETTDNGKVTTLLLTATYDTKPNPMYGLCRKNLRVDPVWNSNLLLPFNSHLPARIDVYAGFDSYNNPVSVKLTETTAGSTTTDATLTYSYQYDAATGFPLQQTVTATGKGGSFSGTTSKVFRFLYL